MELRRSMVGRPLRTSLRQAQTDRPFIYRFYNTSCVACLIAQKLTKFLKLRKFEFKRRFYYAIDTSFFRMTSI